MNKKKVLILVVLICLFAAVAVVLGVVLSRSNDTPNGEETTNKPNESTTFEKDDSKSTESTTSRLESDCTDAGTAETPEPTESTTKPTEPGTKESEPAESTTKPTEPGTKESEPTESTTKPTEPGTKEPEPTESTTKPTEPEPTEPATKPAETEPHIHSFGEWKIVKDSTCKETGTKERVCSCGQKQTESIAKKNHVSDGSNDGIPTISVDGNTATVEIVCSTCNSKVQSPYSGTYLDGENAYSFKDGKRQKLSDGFLTYKGNTYYIVSNIIIKNYYIIDGKVYDFGNNGILVDSVLDKVIVTVGQKQYYVVGNVVQKSGYANVNGQYYELGTDGVISQHSHNFINGVCKCGATDGHTCADNNKDHKCDTCNAVLSTCADNNKDHKCDTCGETLSTCADSDKDHKCDTCGETLSTCADSDKNHKCDTCGKILSECSDTNGDGKCDVCGIDLGKKTSEGLKFTLNADGESYCVAGKGTCKDTDIIIPATYAGKPVTSIGYDAFSRYSNLISITIPSSVTSIDSFAFEKCSKLANIAIPNSVTSIGKCAFLNCTSLASVTIGNSMASIGNSAFEGCTSLTSITIPDSVTSIGELAFLNCTSLTSITIGNSVTSIGSSAFFGCTSLTSVTIPDSVTSIGYSAFNRCSSLTSITIPNSVTSIGSSAFSYTAYYYNNDNWENNVLYIGNHLIEAKQEINEVYIVKVGTVCIASHAFYNCKRLKSITIPNSIKRFGPYTFDACTDLRIINFNGTQEQWNAINKDSGWTYCSGPHTITCTDGTITTY